MNKNKTICIVGGDKELNAKMPIVEGKDYMFVGYVLWDLCKKNENYLKQFPKSSFVSLLDIHTLETRIEEYIPWLKELLITKFMIKYEPNIPLSVKFPKEEIEKSSYKGFMSSFCYMAAYALYKGYKTIELYGCRMLFGDDLIQKEPFEGRLRYAQAKGVKIVTQKDSGMLEIPKDYGYEVNNTLAVYMQKHITARKTLIEIHLDILPSIISDIRVNGDSVHEALEKVLTIKRNFEILFKEAKEFKKEIYDRHGIKAEVSDKER